MSIVEKLFKSSYSDFKRDHMKSSPDDSYEFTLMQTIEVLLDYIMNEKIQLIDLDLYKDCFKAKKYAKSKCEAMMLDQLENNSQDGDDEPTDTTNNIWRSSYKRENWTKRISDVKKNKLRSQSLDLPYNSDIYSQARSRSGTTVEKVDYTKYLVHTSESYFNSHDFNIFKFRQDCKNAELMNAVNHVFNNDNIYQYMCINKDKCMEFMFKIQNGYVNTNPYHNKTHAADLVQTLYYWFNNSKWKNNSGLEYFSKFDKMIMYFSAAVHDYKHPGMNNAFLCANEDPMAYQFNDISVLENMHISEAFNLLKKHNFLKFLDKNEWKVFRYLSIKIVLATDMIFHFEKIKKLKELYTQCSPDGTLDYTKIYDEQNKQLYMEALVHLVDISNFMKPLDVCLNWSYRVIMEFMLQGDKEKELNIPIAQKELFDRDHVFFHNSQIGFYNFVALPLYKEVVVYMDDIWQKNIDGNIAYMKRYKEDKTEGRKGCVPNYKLPTELSKYRVDPLEPEMDEDYLKKYYETNLE